MEKVTSAITDGIRISVKCQYQQKHSSPKSKEFVFAYWITIANESPYTVQLINRHWIIFDSVGSIREVKGEGVVGEQPILKPGDIHKYSSWCPLATPVGRMKGTYGMEREHDGTQLEVVVPEFDLVADFKLN